MKRVTFFQSSLIFIIGSSSAGPPSKPSICVETPTKKSKVDHFSKPDSPTSSNLAFPVGRHLKPFVPNQDDSSDDDFVSAKPKNMEYYKGKWKNMRE